MRSWTVTVVLGCATLGACSLIAPFEATPLNADAQPPDTIADSAADAATDALDDTTVSTPDTAVDMAGDVLEPAPDAGLADGGRVDGYVLPRPCAATASARFTKTKMTDASSYLTAVLCELHDSSVPPFPNQCEAEDALCASGWALCNATEYRAHAGLVPACGSDCTGAWIAGCAKDQLYVFEQLQDRVCTCAAGQTSDEVPVAWTCDPVPFVALRSDSLHLGVVTSSQCSILGTGSNIGAYWTVRDSADTSTSRALCCRVSRLPPTAGTPP